MTFSEVIGQKEVIARLQQMVEENHLPHAMMLCGPQGVGKKALAVAFACYLLSLKDSKYPKDLPESPMLAKLEHPDLHFTFPTIKLASMGSEHMPISDDFISEWRSLLLNSPYFGMDQWMTAIGEPVPGWQT